MKKTLLGALAVCLQLTSLGFTKEPKPQLTPENHLSTSNTDAYKFNKLLVEDFYLAYQNNDSSFLNKIMAKNYGISNAADIHEMNYSKYSEMSKNIKVRVGAMHKALPDFALEVKEVYSDANKVFSKVVISGIQKGDFLGAAATNKPIHINIYAVFTIENGKIAHISEMWNELSIMKQLGCVVL